MAACLLLAERAGPHFLSSCTRSSSPSSLPNPIAIESKNRRTAQSIVLTHLPVPVRGHLDHRGPGGRQEQRQLLTPAVPNMTKTALVALANGAEDVEFIAPVDILRRAGVKVVVASVGDSLIVKTAQGVRIEGELHLKDIPDSEHFDVIILPGGMKGAENCRDCPHLTKLLKAQNAAGRWIAAICASPAVVLNHHGLLTDVKAVAYPSFQSQLKHKGEGRVCVDKHFITSMGPGSAIEFGMEIVKRLVGQEKRDELIKGMCVV